MTAARSLLPVRQSKAVEGTMVLRIAVVGAGITGLSAAWLLSQRHQVVLFESASRIGGHANTVDVDEAGQAVAIDTGFIVYNPPSYPNLTALFQHLAVKTAESRMTFGVSLNAGSIEYSGTGLNGLFAQRSNVLSFSHWQMTIDILRFHREAAAFADHDGADYALTLGQWLTQHRYSNAFVSRHILPMAAAIWSAPADAMLAYPAQSFMRFFANHGLLSASNQPIWRTVVGGSRSYVTAILGAFAGEVRRAAPVVSVTPSAEGVMVTTQGGAPEHFDRVAMCCHADEALALLPQPTAQERRVLGAFNYSQNEAVLHTDRRWMPKRRAVWSSWNYLSAAADTPVTVTYWMNSLQPLATNQNYFVTLNPSGRVRDESHLKTMTYAHPLFNQAALEAQAAIWDLQGNRGIWFAGSYCGAGFHEDGLQAGLAIAEDMTRDTSPVQRPWIVAGQSSRLAMPAGWAIRAKPERAVEAV
jgi:uncharacterized protein